MKVIKYTYLSADLGTEKVFIGKTIPYSEEGLEIAEREAYDGYTIEEVEDREPTAEERIAELEAQNEMLMSCLLEMSEIVYA